MSSRISNLLFLLFSSIILTSASSSPLQSIAISHIKSKTLVCALLPSASAPYFNDLNCTIFPNGTTHHYAAGNTPYSAITAGDGFLCALTSPFSSNLSTMRWWDFDHNPHKNSLPDPKRVYIGPSLASMTAGDNHVCGIIRGELSCWRWPQLQIPKGLIFKKVAVGAKFVCGLLDSGSGIKCFGDDIAVTKNVPKGRFKEVAAGTSHVCAISFDGNFLCWGSGAPELAGKMSVVSIALGNRRTCVLDTAAIVHCWGDIRLPADLVTAQFVNIQARGIDFCGVLMSNYSLICWGSDNFHALNHVVFKQVLPGVCASSCPCLPLPGSGIFCSNGETMCSPCSTSLMKKQTPPTIDNSPKSSEHHRRKLIFIILGSVGFFIGLVLVATFTLFKIKQKNRRVHDSVRLGSRNGRNSVLSRFESSLDVHIRNLFNKGHNSTTEEFSMAYLSSITNDFSNDHKIGSGSFGSVYRAKLKDGRIVAIKRAQTSTSASTSRARTPNGAKSRRQDKESAFCSELSLLSRVHHKNLVRLFGYCKEGSERILVYEFMTKGTLNDLLHKPDGPKLETWAARIKVALDAARGIEYLHTYAVPPIIHRDIKSSNILLDDMNVAKVSDFGLSLLTPDPENVNGSGFDLPFSAAGTVGYMDPEYYRLRQLTAKSDVYSFGVVLLEILSGCRVIQKYEESGTPKNVVEYAIPYIQADNVQHVLDERIGLPTPREMEAVAYLGYLATDCVCLEGRDRPTMTEIVNGLERAFRAVSNPLSPSRSSTTVRSN